MNLAACYGLVLMLAALLPLLVVQRRLHYEIQAVFLLITRRPALAVGLFSVLFFPGVLLHEASHFLMARLLLVRTGRFSLFPQVLPNGTLRLGYVETVRSDLLRDTLVGSAPLLTGGTVVFFLGISRLGLAPISQSISAADWPAFWSSLATLPSQPDFWLWFYLAFAVSSTMLPSPSDRQSWLPLLLVTAFLLALAIFAGAGPWLLENLAPRLNRAFHIIATVFGISLAVHLVLLFPFAVLRRFLNRVTGLQVVD